MLQRAVLITAPLLLLVLPALAESPGDRLRGMSIQVRTSMSMTGRNRGGEYTTPNVRVFKLYISTRGRLFDYTGSGYTNDTGVDRLDENTKISAFGERWETGKVGQQWDLVGNSLIRTRFYPWGQQIYHIAISGDLRSCSVRGTMISTNPEGKFFFYDSHDGQPNEVLSHGADTGSCRIMRGNVFSPGQE